MTTLLIILGFVLLVGCLIGVCTRELLMNYYNPILKFGNGDKRIGEIKVMKTRSIVNYSSTEDNSNGRTI